MRTAYERDFGLFLGEYHALDAVPGGFVAAYPMAKPFARRGLTDIFFQRIVPRG